MAVAILAVALLVAVFFAIAIARRLAVPEVPVPSPEGQRPRIVVVGGGFAGVYTAAALDGAGYDLDVVLVSKENHFTFQPLLPEVISGSIGLYDVVSPLRRLLPKTEVHVREVESIDLEKRTVSTSAGFLPHPHVLRYDHLVLALGTVTDFRGLRGLPEHALPFKTFNDALDLRNHVIRALEEAAIELHDETLRKKLLTFVVAGGGFSGVEVCAELNDFVRTVARSYRGVQSAEIRVVLVHSQDRILPELSEKLALYAERLLRERGVEGPSRRSPRCGHGRWRRPCRWHRDRHQDAGLDGSCLSPSTHRRAAASEDEERANRGGRDPGGQRP
jgi:NADH dehydrogenase FAD-containing subunit